jgi:hypothetical protein
MKSKDVNLEEIEMKKLSSFPLTSEVEEENSEMRTKPVPMMNETFEGLLLMSRENKHFYPKNGSLCQRFCVLFSKISFLGIFLVDLLKFDGHCLFCRSGAALQYWFIINWI